MRTTTNPISDESIYNWIKSQRREIVKDDQYRSRHDFKAPVSYSTFNAKAKKFGTMGRPQPSTPDTDKFLKKGDGLTNKTIYPDDEVQQYTRPIVKPRREKVPGRDEKPVYGLVSDKNYIIANAIENILSSANIKEPPSEGFMKTEGYGKTPEYVKTIQREMADEEEKVKAYMEAKRIFDENKRKTQPELSRKTMKKFGFTSKYRDDIPMRKLDEEERIDLLHKLKLRWQTINNIYQKEGYKQISTTNSTAGSVRRKEAHEVELDELEGDIETLSHPNIWIYGEDNMPTEYK